MAQPPFVAVPEEAWRRRHDLSSGEWELYEAYCSHRNRLTGRCDPSVKFLAQELECTPGHVSDMKRELLRKGWIRRLGRRDVELLVGEFPRPKVAEIGGPNHGIFRDSGTEFSVIGLQNHGKFRSQITENSGAHNKDEPVVVEPIAAAASAAGEPADSDPWAEVADDQFVAEVIEAAIYPDGHVLFVWKKLLLYCKKKETKPVRRQFMHWLATERHTPQQELPGMAGKVGAHPAPGHEPIQTRRCDSSCPRCFGTQMEVVPGKGAHRCPNRVAAPAPAASPTAVNGGELSGGN